MSDKSLTEQQFQKQVVQLAKLYKWRVAHFRCVRVQRRGGAVYYETPVGVDGKGWPDLVMLRGNRLVVAELKVGKNKTTPEQDAWLAAFRSFEDAEVYLWRPSDWHEIESVLTKE